MILKRGDVIIDTFGKRLKELRSRLGLSQEGMAERLGVARSTYALYETDKREPSLKVASRMRQLAGEPLSSLFDKPYWRDLGLTDEQKKMVMSHFEKEADSKTDKARIIRSLLTAEGYEVIVSDDVATVFFVKNNLTGIAIELDANGIADLYDSLIQYLELRLKEMDWNRLYKK